MTSKNFPWHRLEKKEDPNENKIQLNNHEFRMEDQGRREPNGNDAFFKS